MATIHSVDNFFSSLSGVLGTAGGQGIEQGIANVISKADPNLPADPTFLSRLWAFIAAMDPAVRMTAFTALGTFILHSRAPLLVRMALGNVAFAVPEGFDRLLQRRDLTAAKLTKAIKAKVEEVENTRGTEAAYCGNDVRSQIHLVAVHPLAADHDPLAYVSGNLIMVANHCYPRQNLCPVCFPFGTASVLPQPVASSLPVDAEPNPLVGLSLFISPLKARWVKDLYAAILAEKRGNPNQGLKGRARPLAVALAKAVAEDPLLVEANVPTTLPHVGPPNDLTQMPGVQAFLAAIEMRAEYIHPSHTPEVTDALSEFLQGFPGLLRPLVAKFHQHLDGSDALESVKRTVGRLFWVTLAFAGLCLLGLLLGFVWLGSAFVITALGIYWPSSFLIGAGLLGVIVWRFLMPIMDMPLNLFAGLVDFLDPTDGTGMIGGTVRGIVDWFDKSKRSKTPPEDRESITYFADRAVSVAVVWSIVSGIGFILAMLSDPMSSPPAMALVLAGGSAIYFASDTFRKGWRRIGKHDEHRYVPATWRVKVMRSSVIIGTGVGTSLMLLGILLGLTVGYTGSARMLMTSQTLGARAVHQFATANNVRLSSTEEECEVGLSNWNRELDKIGQTRTQYCDLTNDAFPCDCL